MCFHLHACFARGGASRCFPVVPTCLPVARRRRMIYPPANAPHVAVAYRTSARRGRGGPLHQRRARRRGGADVAHRGADTDGGRHLGAAQPEHAAAWAGVWLTSCDDRWWGGAGVAMTNICRQGECASCESWNSWCYTGWYIFKSVPEEVVVKCVLHVGFRVSIVLAVTAAATS